MHTAFLYNKILDQLRIITAWKRIKGIPLKESMNSACFQCNKGVKNMERGAFSHNERNSCNDTINCEIILLMFQNGAYQTLTILVLTILALMLLPSLVSQHHVVTLFIFWVTSIVFCNLQGNRFMFLYFIALLMFPFESYS